MEDGFRTKMPKLFLTLFKKIYIVLLIENLKFTTVTQLERACVQNWFVKGYIKYKG